MRWPFEGEEFFVWVPPPEYPRTPLDALGLTATTRALISQAAQFAHARQYDRAEIARMRAGYGGMFDNP